MLKVPEAIKRWERRKNDRTIWMSNWQENADYFLPTRNSFYTKTEGERRYVQYDPMPVYLVNELAAAFSDLVTPGDGSWVRYDPEDPSLLEDKECRTWLQNAERLCVRSIYRKEHNFQRANAAVWADVLVFGNGCLFMPESPYTGVMFKARHLKNVAVDLDEFDRVKYLWFDEEMSAEKAFKRFGNIGARAKECIDKRPDQKFHYLQFIAPSDDRELIDANHGGLPYASYVIEVESEEVISEAGFRSWPAAFTRGKVETGEIYGRAVADDALPSVRTSNIMKRDILTAAEWAVRPPMWAIGGAVTGSKNLLPGHWIYGDPTLSLDFGARPFGPVEQGGQVQLGQELLEMERDTIRKIFMQHLFNLPTDGPRMNVLQVQAMLQQQMKILTPIITMFEEDYTGVIADRVFNEMEHFGFLGPRPEKLKNEHISFHMGTPLRKLKAQLQMTNLAASFEMMGAMMAIPQFQGAADNLDADNVIRDIMQMNDNPEKYLVNVRTRDQSRKQMQELQMAQMGLQAGQQMADIKAKEAASTRTGGAQQ